MKNLLSISLFIFLSFNSYSQSCSGTPNGGNTVSNTTFACANDTIQLTVINSTIGNGLTYQWQWSADSTTWQDIAGITTDSFITQQTGTSYYRRIINCGDSNSFSVPVKVSAKPFLQCYCKPAASNCTQNDLIKKVVMATLSNSSTCSANGYIDYSGTVAAPSVNEATVLPVSVTVSAGGTEYVSMWIDYNQDGIFGADEYSSIGFGNGITITGLVHLLENIPTGLTKMRIRVRYGSNLNNTDACSTIAYGETEDYAINILPAPLCSTLPNGGITNASVPTICPVDSITLTVSNATTGFTGLTYQWQQSADGIVWNNIAGDTNISVTLQQTTATYYRRMIACSSLQSYSAPVPVAMKDTNLCYCKPASSVCNTTATITSVRFSSIHNLSNCSPLAYGDYTQLPPTPVQPGITIPITVSASSLNNSLINYYAVWIDYNRNGFFESTEYTNLGSLQGTGILNGNIVIPANASLGTTGMRIRSRYNTAMAAIDACTTFQVSETEDYILLMDTACKVNIWTGMGGNSSWEDVANWSCMQLPDANATVVINSGTVVVSSNPTIYSLLLNPQANLAVSPSFNLTVTH